MGRIYSSRQEVYERSGREESAKRVYATTHRRVIHMKLSSEMIPVNRCQEFDVERYGSAYGPNAHALSLRNNGEIGGDGFMFK